MNVILCDSLHTDICICGLFISCNEILLCKQIAYEKTIFATKCISGLIGASPLYIS